MAKRDPGDVSAQLALRQKNKCHSFQWYMDQVSHCFGWKSARIHSGCYCKKIALMTILWFGWYYNIFCCICSAFVICEHYEKSHKFIPQTTSGDRGTKARMWSCNNRGGILNWRMPVHFECSVPVSVHLQWNKLKIRFDLGRLWCDWWVPGAAREQGMGRSEKYRLRIMYWFDGPTDSGHFGRIVLSWTWGQSGMLIRHGHGTPLEDPPPPAQISTWSFPIVNMQIFA